MLGGNEHPLADAIVHASEERRVDLGEATGFESVTGNKVGGDIDGRAVALVNLGLMTQLDIELRVPAEKAGPLRVEGQTVMFVALERKAAGLVSVADPIKGDPRASAPRKVRGLVIPDEQMPSRTKVATIHWY